MTVHIAVYSPLFVYAKNGKYNLLSHISIKKI